MKPILCVLAITVCCAAVAQAQVQLASRGRARAVVVTQPGATPTELYAARDLADTLARVTGAPFEVRQNVTEAPEGAIVVGPGPLSDRLFPGQSPGGMGGEEGCVRTANGRLLLAGGRPRGTLYAVYRFLQDDLGVRWWTPWADRVPQRQTLSVPALDRVVRPAFEARDPFWFPAFNGTWAARNGSNSQSASLTPEQGGKVVYKGFVHTFFPLVPPQEHFAAHPEWYSLIDGQRRHQGAQLCTTNPQLRDHMVERVRAWLKESPDARIVSISQNDWYGACQCPNCKAVDDREGSHAGSMLELVNYIAAKLGPEFPDVAYDTLAYQYTRKAPRNLKPLPNVIVRLCSIECNFAEPLEHPSNKAFADDIRDWSRLSNRLYIWDYTTNFAHYVAPHPNYKSLGPNVRFFHQHGVRGMFEQGAYQSFGSEMSELRSWVLAQLLWNPYQDDRKLTAEFVDGYYGRGPGKFVRQYMDLMTRAARGYYMGCFNNPASSPFLRFDVLSKAEKLWQQAEDAARGNPDLVWRVRQARLPVWYAWLVRWTPLRRQCLIAKADWPVPASRKELAARWLSVATGPGPDGWRPMTHVNEGGLTPEAFVARFQEDPADPVAIPVPTRGKRPAPPPDVPEAAVPGIVDAQDDAAGLADEGTLAELAGDPAASDGIAVRMPGSHHEWATQVHAAKLPERARKGRWRVYAVIRIEKAPGAAAEGVAFTAGAWDTEARKDLGGTSAAVADVPEGYKSYLIGEMDMRESVYLWAAPTANNAVKAVWVDRFWLVPVR